MEIKLEEQYQHKKKKNFIKKNYKKYNFKTLKLI
jgi:hypothetical protein